MDKIVKCHAAKKIVSECGWISWGEILVRVIFCECRVEEQIWWACHELWPFGEDIYFCANKTVLILKFNLSMGFSLFYM